MSDDSAACLEQMWAIVFGRVDAFAGLCIALGKMREEEKKSFAGIGSVEIPGIVCVSVNKTQIRIVRFLFFLFVSAVSGF